MRAKKRKRNNRGKEEPIKRKMCNDKEKDKVRRTIRREKDDVTRRS